MPNEMPYSFLVWENVDNLPFPDDVKLISQNIKWDEFDWQAVGLPISDAKYTMSGGKELYLSELPNGDIKVEKMVDFTGKILIGSFFLNEQNNDGFNYFITFIVTVVKGKVLEVEMERVTKQPTKEYNEAMAEFEKNLHKVMHMSESWWFKYIYRPWFLLVRGVGYACLFILKFLKSIVIWTISRLTPL